MMKKLLFLATIVIALAFAVTPAMAANGFNQYGYNYTARLFNGTGESWSLAKGLPADYLGIYAKDKLVMNWGQFAVLMDQGKDPSYGSGHLWFAHAKPTGYGAY